MSFRPRQNGLIWGYITALAAAFFAIVIVAFLNGCTQHSSRELECCKLPSNPAAVPGYGQDKRGEDTLYGCTSKGGHAVMIPLDEHDGTVTLVYEGCE